MDLLASLRGAPSATNEAVRTSRSGGVGLGNIYFRIGMINVDVGCRRVYRVPQDPRAFLLLSLSFRYFRQQAPNEPILFDWLVIPRSGTTLVFGRH